MSIKLQNIDEFKNERLRFCLQAIEAMMQQVPTQRLIQRIVCLFVCFVEDKIFFFFYVEHAKQPMPFQLPTEKTHKNIIRFELYIKN